MKTTVKLNSCSRVTVLPTQAGTVLVEIESSGEPMAVFSLTQDQVGALVFGLEQAAARANARKLRAAA